MPTDTKTALLNSAERAARSLGFDGFSYADLAEDVGIRKASIHHHFPSKAILSVELMRRYQAVVESECAKIQASAASGAARISALVDLYRTGLGGGKTLCLCVSFSANPESLPSDVIDQIKRFRAMIIRWLISAFEAGHTDGSIAGIVDARLEGAALLPLLEGAQLAARAEEDEALFDTALQLFKRRLSL